MKISEFEGEQALDLLADLIEPTAIILADSKIKSLQAAGASLARIAGTMIKDHKPEVMQILAAMDGVPVDEYKCTPFKAIKQLMDLLNDEELMSFFKSAPESTEQKSSGSATEITEGADE